MAKYQTTTTTTTASTFTCKTCIDLMSAGSKHRAKIPNPAD